MLFRSKNVISAIHEHELNGLIRADVELDLSYANKFLVLGIDHVGYYYKDEFYLHKIQRVEYDHVNETATVVLRHIFFEDMIFGKLIQDVRPQNQDALTVSRQTIDANTRWQTIMTDATGRLSTNFYWQVPYEVIEFMTKNYRIEYLPKILFDGQKINGFQLHLANKIGEDKNIRIPYGSRVLDLKYEEDYSEIITKLVVHGKGEEVGDGYGRRINISDVNFSRNGVKSPVGSLYLEDKSITNTYGNDGQTPREGREIFEDIDDVNELAEAGYQHYLQVSRPQMLFTADVSDIGDVGIGDSVMIIRREYNVYFSARIHKLSVDLLYPEDAQVELGDYKHFKESKVERKSREKNNRVQGQLSDRISRLKQEANDRFDNEVKQWFEEYEQALIDAQAKVEAMRTQMTEELSTVRKDMTERFESEKAAAQEEAQRNYDAISGRITNVVDTTRTEMNTAFENSVKESKAFATQEAKAKAQAVQSNLSTFETKHNQIISDFKGSVSSSFESINSEVLGLTSGLGTLRESIDATERALNEVEEDLGNSKTDLQKKLDEARAEIEGLEVGGRNYIKDSKVIPMTSADSGARDNTEHISTDDYIEIKSNKDFQSYWYRYYAINTSNRISDESIFVYDSDYQTFGIDILTESDNFEMYINQRQADHSNSYSSDTISLPNTNGKWQRIYITLPLKHDGLQRSVFYVFISGGKASNPNAFLTNDYIRLKKSKLEKGNKGTDWTPAPEDTEQKITNINQTITNIEGELSSKVEQTEVDALKSTVTDQGTLLTQTAEEVSSKAEKSVVDTLTGRVTNAESSVTQNAEEIAKKLTKSVYDSDKEVTDAKITQWSNLTTETAEGLEQTISRLSNEEGKISKAQADIKANADEIALKASQSDLNSVTGRVSTAESQLSVQAGQISSVVGKVDGNTTNISSVLQDTKSIKSTIASIEKDLATQGSEIDQALDSITGKVWLGDVGGRNLLPKTDLPNDRDHWKERGTDVTINQTSTRGLTDYLWMNRYGGEANRYIAVLSPLLTEDVVEGHEYTIQFKTAHRVNVNEKFSYVYLMNEDGTVNQPTFDSQQTVIEIGENDYDGKQIQLHTVTLKANFSGRARILIGTHSVGSGNARFYVKEPKIEKGKATAYSRAPEDFLQMSELKITPGYWQLGSTRIDGESVSSVLRGSPDSIDAIVSEMNLTGNLNVKGQIETISMNAVKGEFADLFAARVKAGDVDIDNITGRTAWFERLYTLNANIEKLTAQFVFTDAIHAKSLDAIEANIGRVRTAFLKADVISGTHIKSNTIEIKHLTGYDAILEMLMARKVFSSEVTTLSLNAVEANIGSVRSQILTSNVIKSSHIAGGTALIDKIFSSTAMFERMMSKKAFITTLNTVSIDTDQLTIRRADGGVLISNGTQKFGSPIITKPFPDTGVDFDGTNYVTTLRSSKTFERAYGEHAGRYANFSFRIGLDWSAKSASTYMRIVIRPGNLPSGVSVPLANERFIVYRGEQKSETISVRLPVPTFGAISWTLEFYREGSNVTDPVTIRSERCWISA